MRRTRIAALACAAGISASLALSGAPLATAQPTAGTPKPAVVLGHWGNAIPMPGATALTKVTTWINAVSCAPSGDCALGGEYSDDTLGDGQAFVATAQNGTWGNAVKLPGTVGVTTNGGHSEVNAVSCATAYCVAAGELATGPINARAFVSVWRRGVWGQATIIPGLETAVSQVMAVSCPTPGNCTVGGWYQQPTRALQAFVADEVNGTWGHYQDLGELARINTGGLAEIDSMSCGSPGNCVGAGYYTNSSGRQAFFGHEISGSWFPAQIVLHIVPPSTATTQSCPASGACAILGTSQDASGHTQAFTASVLTGISQPIAIPNLVALNAGGNAGPTSVSCASAGNCVAGGYYTDMTGAQDAFVAEEKGGTWGNAMPVPGSIALNAGGVANVQNISCPSTGNCAVSGFYTDANGNEQIFVADEVNGTWGDATRLPGPASTGNNSGAHVACWSAGNCTAGGAIITSGHLQALVATETSG